MNRIRLCGWKNSSAAPLPADRESLFYFNVREIPPAPKAHQP
ncbi:fimbria/pilus periplasmic chaperone [Salmonella enterica]|nr:fimbria/pilus periplasmic chaperone [Salmonella enterica]HEC8458244.1 fimbria/pilus periplasmic chaperone [Salmonella enterica subsp. enterica serovar Poona]